MMNVKMRHRHPTFDVHHWTFLFLSHVKNNIECRMPNVEWRSITLSSPEE